MANDQNASHARRPAHHRRRGSDRRTHERAAPPQRHPGPGDQVDVEQIMRDIRARIPTRHGIELTRAQVQELAARRLDAILEPRHIKPELMEQLRRAAGEPIHVPPAAPAEQVPDLDEAALYQSHRSVLRLVRGWLKPLLKLFINPAPLIEAINTEQRRARAAAAREADLYTRQAQWNALHYEILQRLVTDVARATIETQSLSMRIDSLAAKLDFTEHRLGALEQVLQSGRAATRPQEVRSGASDSTDAVATPPAEGTGDGSRRRRRRRRGRRSGLATVESGAIGADADEADLNDEDAVEAVETADLEPDGETPEEARTTPLEPAHSFSLLQPVERQPHEGRQPPEERELPQASDGETPAPPAEVPPAEVQEGRAAVTEPERDPAPAPHPLESSSPPLDAPLLQDPEKRGDRE